MSEQSLDKNKETRGFQSEVKQLLHLMIHSLYSNKEIFLRELISNASDAADKLRFRALSDGLLYENDAELTVKISVNQDAGTLTISDNGIGMTREDVIEHLGTIAKSGTKEFFAKLNEEETKDSQLIGQFGVGFYSAFIVADSVTVNTRAAGVPADQAVSWSSAGEGDYTVENTTKATRGTDIILHLRDDEKEFLDEYRLRDIISKYSDHIGIPVLIQTTERDEEGNETGKKWEQINKAQALWTRNKSDISDEEFKEFYKHVSHDFAEPLTWSLNHVEGKQDYTSLLYIPSKAPWDLYHRDSQHGLKLYVQRVFIMDDAQQFMPMYLRFMRGLIDSNDLPLNVSREILQDNKVTQALRKACTKRALSMLSKLAKGDSEKYQTFWQEFGQVIKEGLAEDFANRDKIAQLLRFSSTYNDSAEQTVALADYVERMKEGQDKIYYITADNFNAAKNSPHLEQFRAKGIEVLLMHDRIDEWMMSYMPEFEGKGFQSITKSDLDLSKFEDEAEKEKHKETEEAFKSVVERTKEYLGSRVKDVRTTFKLHDTPAVVVTDENEMGTQMAKLLAAAGQEAPEVQYILELNPDHALVKQMADEADEEIFGRWVEMLLGQSLLAERGAMDDPSRFLTAMNQLLAK
ncbi:Chaperone protein HtpG [Photobacterium damselae subsp. piscicida]|uniref:Chaperone protein HtpG n=1 Tax=Photobacterium damsela subsp. piscicida TaxID=38294 RepID=A0A1V1VAK3_PHODP|nr:molecular chaperone HtpG [Photobacterium damselae]MBE8129713.1 molecular chaperone HtpG [Photobacterium damselae subsp. piscicida]PSV80564.1 molecular chaperone HtpG [Photobacterium damselae]PSW85010.1 molecular chaperone HtpG [Photobacterium damselae]QOD51916.1 molecular chaperone HtpG [Photobacterium damselae subsp. piscicida]QOD55770.1 molecular chaperone HtpG [Photobacterium damselae subsp. piscicida]